MRHGASSLDQRSAAASPDHAPPTAWWPVPRRDEWSVTAGQDLPAGQNVSEPVIDEAAFGIIRRNEEKHGRPLRRALEDPLGEASELAPLAAQPFADGGEGRPAAPKGGQNGPDTTPQQREKA